MEEKYDYKKWYGEDVEYDEQRELSDEDDVNIDEEDDFETIQEFIKYYRNYLFEVKKNVDDINNKYRDIAPNGILPFEIILK